ncbi:MAG: hypothetical protein LBU16_01600 [Treponema sp.]|nr:hypothetical protein [Treponema sp.]
MNKSVVTFEELEPEYILYVVAPDTAFHERLITYGEAADAVALTPAGALGTVVPPLPLDDDVVA